MKPFARQTTPQAFEPPGSAADSSGHVGGDDESLEAIIDRAEQRARDANSDLRKESKA